MLAGFMMIMVNHNRTVRQHFEGGKLLLIRQLDRIEVHVDIGKHESERDVVEVLKLVPGVLCPVIPELGLRRDQEIHVRSPWFSKEAKMVRFMASVNAQLPDGYFIQALPESVLPWEGHLCAKYFSRGAFGAWFADPVAATDDETKSAGAAAENPFRTASGRVRYPGFAILRTA